MHSVLPLSSSTHHQILDQTSHATIGKEGREREGGRFFSFQVCRPWTCIQWTRRKKTRPTSDSQMSDHHHPRPPFHSSSSSSISSHSLLSTNPSPSGGKKTNKRGKQDPSKPSFLFVSESKAKTALCSAKTAMKIRTRLHNSQFDYNYSFNRCPFTRKRFPCSFFRKKKGSPLSSFSLRPSVRPHSVLFLSSSFLLPRIESRPGAQRENTGGESGREEKTARFRKCGTFPSRPRRRRQPPPWPSPSCWPVSSRRRVSRKLRIRDDKLEYLFSS